MNATPTRYVVRLTIGTDAWDIDPDDTQAVSDAMRSLHAAREAGLSGSMARVPASLPMVADADVDTDVDDESDEPTTQDRPIPAAVRVPATPPQDTTPADGSTISAVAVARITQHEAWAAEGGFALPPPIFAAGTRVIALGERNFRAERQRVESLPMFGDAARTVIDQIAAEQRDDWAGPMCRLSMDETGRLVLPDGTRLGMERDAFDRLAGRGGFGCGARYLAGLPVIRRASNVTADLAACDPQLGVMLRHRATESGTRAVYATLSPSYAVCDADKVLRTAIPHLADARTEIVYDGTSTRATSLWMPDHVVDLAAGDVFKSGVRISTDDTGGGKVRVEAVLFRNLCLNLIVIGEATSETMARVHKGDAYRILRDLGPAIREARSKVAPFLDAWGHARQVQCDPMAELRRLVFGGALAPSATKDREATLGTLIDAWRAEPGATWADVVNACTRAAHESRDLTAEYRAHLEARAAQLVYAPRA